MDPIQTQNPQQNDANTTAPATPTEGANPFDLVKDGEQTVPTPEAAPAQPAAVPQAAPAQSAVPAKPAGGGKIYEVIDEYNC